MSFSDLKFLFYFLPLFLAAYYLVPRWGKNALLVLGSFVCYLCGAGVRDTVILLAAVAVNYALACWMDTRIGSARRTILLLGLSVNLLCLAFFKYAGFLAADTTAGKGLSALVLPLGLSFYLFQSVSYLIDVYRGERAERNPVDYAAFVTAFPQLVMGPILRYRQWRSALRSRTLCRAEVERGFELFVAGLCMKVLLADRLAPLWASLERIGFAYLSTPLAWLGAVGYSLQLYLDFNGYSLMAMGLGQMLGLPIPRNFDLPYLSRSVSEFYRRWHITLGTWFRDYLYIPLGGSRQGKARCALALTVVWFFTGLWHGATWNFLIWGFVLLAFILLEKFCIGGFLRRHPVLSHLYVLLVIPPTWVIFHIADLPALGDYMSRLFPFFTASGAAFSGDFLKYFASYWWLIALGVLFCLPFPRRFFERFRGTLLLDLPLFVLFWLCVYFISISAGNPFLYFRF